jgi:hypothetical protein
VTTSPPAPDEAGRQPPRRHAPLLWWVGAAIVVAIATAYRACS